MTTDSTTLRELADKLTKSAQIFHEYAFDENCANVTQAIEELRRYADLLDGKVVVAPGLTELIAKWRAKSSYTNVYYSCADELDDLLAAAPAMRGGEG